MAKRGILLMNLGSPDTTRIPDVRKYLDEFLMDGRVIDYPWFFRNLLVRGIVIPARVKKSAAAYASIWTEEGSPLMVLTRQLEDAVQAKTQDPVKIAMRYGSPGPKEALDAFAKENPDLEELTVVPLYPHYAMSSYETAVLYARDIHEKGKYPFRLSFIKPFYDNADYLAALVERIRPYLSDPYDHILFSYHGIPERHIRKSDPTNSHCLNNANCCSQSSEAHKYCYRHQVFTTTWKLTEMLGIPKEKYSISFQSRLGKGWLQPFTDKRLEAMPAEGIKNLLILCPAFVSDCLETLEEIAVEGKHSFMEAGGSSFQMIPCLNDQPQWVNTLVKWHEELGAGDRGMVWQSKELYSSI